MRYVVFYEATNDFMDKVPLHMAAHQALWAKYHGAGTLLFIGPFTDAPAGGAMGVFATREAAEAFVGEDPFVRHEVVARWTIREWNEVLGT